MANRIWIYNPSSSVSQDVIDLGYTMYPEEVHDMSIEGITEVEHSTDLIDHINAGTLIWLRSADPNGPYYDPAMYGGDITNLFYETNAQPQSEILESISTLTTTGLIVNVDGSSATSISIEGTTKEIDVSNGDGVSGNPTIKIADDPTFPGTGGVRLPSGTSIQRPNSDLDGILRFNIDSHSLETYDEHHEQWLTFLDSLHASDMREPTGFVDRTSSMFSFNNGTRTFTLEPVAESAHVHVYYRGARIGIHEPVSVQISDTDGLHIIKFLPSGDLIDSATVDVANEIIVAMIFWNVAYQMAIFIADERHGIQMDGFTHKYLHLTRGYQWYYGNDIIEYTTTGDGSQDSHAQFGVTNGAYFDEDIDVEIKHSATPSAFYEQVLNPVAYIPIYFRAGVDGPWAGAPAGEFCVMNGTFGSPITTTRAMYNKNTNDTWSTEEAQEGYYFAMYLIATNGIQQPVVAVMGQREDSTLDAAKENNGLSSLDFGDFGLPEIKPIHILIFQTSSAYTNQPKARLVHIIDTRMVAATQVALSGGATAHGSLSGLSEDDHPQYVHVSSNRTISARHTFDSPAGPFVVGPASYDQLVGGLNADKLDGYHASAFQPVDNDLTALSQLGTTGIAVRTTTDTWALRSVNAGTGISVTNGDGVDGNITISATNNGTVTSVAATQPVAGFTVSGGPITTDGTLVFTLADDLAAVEGITTTGLVTRTATDAWTTRTLTAGTGISITNGDGVNGNVTITNTAPNVNYNSFNTIVVAGQSDVIADDVTDTLTLVAGSGISITTNATTDTITINATNNGTVTSVAATQPAAGLTISGSPITTSGTLTFALADDLAALEQLTTSGIAVRTGTDTWATRTLIAGTGISISNANGSGGDITIANTSPNVNQNLFETIAVSGQSSVVADSPTDTLTLVAGSGISITTNATTDTITITNTVNTNTFSTFAVAGQSNVVADSAADTLTLVAGTGIIITTNATTDTITVTAANNGTVTSVDASGGTTGLSFSGGPITSSGTLTLSGTLAATNGGTGLSSLGTANQVLGVNNGATALEYKTLTAGSGISITHAANSVTIANTLAQTIIVQDEGTPLAGGPFTTLNFVGATVAATPAGTGVAQITVSGGSGAPAAPTTSIQFNNSGAFGGTARNVWDNTNNIQTISGAASQNRLTLYDGAGTVDTTQRANAALYIQVDGDATYEGLRTYFKRSSAGISGWITYHYDQNTPNIRLTDEDDDAPYIAFNTISTGTYDDPLHVSVFGARGTYGSRDNIGDNPGFAWFIGNNTNPVALITAYQPVMELDSQWLRIPTGTTLQRPSPAVNGMIRYNTTTNKLEGYEGGAWADLVQASGGGGTFGGNFQQASTDAESSTTSAAFQQKLRLTTPSLPSGTYRIGYSVEGRCNSTTVSLLLQVQINDTTTIGEARVESQDVANYDDYSGFYYYTGSGVLNIDLDYCSSTGGTTSYTRRARLEIWRVS